MWRGTELQFGLSKQAGRVQGTRSSQARLIIDDGTGPE